MVLLLACGSAIDQANRHAKWRRQEYADCSEDVDCLQDGGLECIEAAIATCEPSFFMDQDLGSILIVVVDEDCTVTRWREETHVVEDSCDVDCFEDYPDCPAKLVIEPEALEFDGTGEQQVTLSNTGHSALRIAREELPESVFGVESALGLELEPGEAVRLRVWFEAPPDLAPGHLIWDRADFHPAEARSADLYLVGTNN